MSSTERPRSSTRPLMAHPLAAVRAPRTARPQMLLDAPLARAPGTRAP